MGTNLWARHLLELIRRTSTDLPSDVEAALRRAQTREKKGSHAWWVLASALQSASESRAREVPICQDTGTLIFHFTVPVGCDAKALTASARQAVGEATRRGWLRENTIDSITGAPYGDNVAAGSPVFHFAQGVRRTVDVRLLMKGGGCENVGVQYALPDSATAAGRDLEGVRRCILDAVWKAQGNGCAPGILGVCIGGDRASGMAHAKEQFLRGMDARSEVPILAKLEQRVMRESRELRIGPMGLGGRTTLLGVKIGALSRVPASFFVSVSYMCWAFRRRGVVVSTGGKIQRWLY